MHALRCGTITKMVGFKHESPMGLEVGLLASAGRGFSPPTCIVLYCEVLQTFHKAAVIQEASEALFMPWICHAGCWLPSE